MPKFLLSVVAVISLTRPPSNSALQRLLFGIPHEAFTSEVLRVNLILTLEKG